MIKQYKFDKTRVTNRKAGKNQGPLQYKFDKTRVTNRKAGKNQSPLIILYYVYASKMLTLQYTCNATLYNHVIRLCTVPIR
jgi:hypothetical protein